MVDIFGGFNTAGQMAEAEGRKWLSFETLPEYVSASSFLFLEKGADPQLMQEIYQKIIEGKTVVLIKYRKQIAMNF